MTLLLALLAAQLGPQVSPGAAPPLPHQEALPARTKARTPPPVPAEECPQADNPIDAADAAGEWVAAASGKDKARAGECLGVALSGLDRWDEAAGAFRTASAAADTPIGRARLGAMAGEASLNAGDAQAALAALDAAKADAGDERTILAGIAVFRARALVALKREAEAVAPLAEARAARPDDPYVWLLSATLSRRMGRLGEAQQEIQRAAELLPIDPEIGLEAGLIAVLSGRDAAARKSWESVIAAAPSSAAAATAKGYIAQLGPQSMVEPVR